MTYSSVSTSQWKYAKIWISNTAGSVVPDSIDVRVRHFVKGVCKEKTTRPELHGPGVAVPFKGQGGGALDDSCKRQMLPTWSSLREGNLSL